MPEKKTYPSEIATGTISVRIDAGLKKRVAKVQKRLKNRSWSKTVVENALSNAVAEQETELARAS